MVVRKLGRDEGMELVKNHFQWLTLLLLVFYLLQGSPRQCLRYVTVGIHELLEKHTFCFKRLNNEYMVKNRNYEILFIINLIFSPTPKHYPRHFFPFQVVQ
jgi:hypothetical protein